MKNKFVYVLLVMGVLLLSMPVTAQQQEWQSTSAMKGTNSAYSPQVTAVGETTVGEMATTTESYSPAKVGIHKAPPINPRPGDPTIPIGDALIPLMLCACAYLIIRARKRANKGERANG